MTVRFRFRSHVFVVPEPRWAELWSGTGALFWGFYVMTSPESLGDRAPYLILGGIASDQQWGASGVVVGLYQIAAAITNRRLTRAFSNTIATTFWAFLFTGIALNSLAGFPGIVLYANQALMNFVSLVCVLIAWGFTCRARSRSPA